MPYLLTDEEFESILPAAGEFIAALSAVFARYLPPRRPDVIEMIGKQPTM